MSDAFDLMVSFPTVVFTVPLVFCLLWFLLGLVVSGFDIGDSGDFDLDIDHDGSIDGLEHFVGALHLGDLGLPLALLMLSFGGWTSSLLFAVAVREAGVENMATIAVGLVLGLVAGFVFVWRVGGSLGRALATNEAPERNAAVGHTCRVRTVDVTPTFGDAEILTGAMRTSLVKVRAASGQFRRGDIAVLGELDPVADAYWLSPVVEDAIEDLS